LQPASNIHAVCCLWDSGHIGLGPFRVWNNMQREEMGIVNGSPMGMGISMVGEWEWEWLYGNGTEWESERHSRTPLL